MIKITCCYRRRRTWSWLWFY